MSTQQQREKLAELLELVASGQLSASAALSRINEEKWSDVLWQERLFDHAWHVLGHFREDADTREKDPSFAEASRIGLLKYAKQLREPQSTCRKGR
jgi:hypothetical protein